MTEPRAKAKKVVQVREDLFRWTVSDDRIGGHPSDAHAILSGGKLTLIDPLPVDPALLREIGEVEAIILTAGNHQRSAWRFRKEFQAPVYAPEKAYKLLEKPDLFYAGGVSLPGRLVAFHTPGPVESMHVLWQSSPKNTVFMSDLLMHDGEGGLTFVADEVQDEPDRTRMSVRRVLEQLMPDSLCFAHGPPLLDGAKTALEQALRDAGEEVHAER